jgi:Ni/Co efflux regulator RcnB
MRKTLLAALLAASAVASALAAPAGCPPGVARKHNGCLPPGPAKKTYRDAVIGHRVPPNAVYAIPQHVRVTLPRPPFGYRYAVVNEQVVLVSRTNIVVDIVRDIIG